MLCTPIRRLWGDVTAKRPLGGVTAKRPLGVILSLGLRCAATERKKLKWRRRDHDETGCRLVPESPFLSLVPEDSDPELVTRGDTRDPD